MRCDSEAKPIAEVRTFFWYFRPIALICKLVGAFPIQWVHCKNAKKLSFSYTSLSNIYSIALFIADMGAMTYFSQLFFLAMFDMTFIWKAIVIYMLILRSVICFLFCNSNCRRLITMLRQLDMFDVKKEMLFETHRYKGWLTFVKRSLLPVFGLILLLVTGFKLLSSFVFETLQPDQKLQIEGQLTAALFGLLGIWQLVPLYLYVYFAFVIKSNLKEVNKTLEESVPVQCLCDLEKPIYNSDIQMILENVRHLYSITQAVVKSLNVSYGKFLAIDQLTLILMFTVNLYVFFFTTNRDDYLLYCTALNAGIVIVVVDISQGIKDEATVTADLLQKIFLSSVDTKTSSEIQTFLMQMSVQPIEISAAGFFILDRRQVSSILASVATYMIVLIQYAPKFQGDFNATSFRSEPLIRLDHIQTDLVSDLVEEFEP